ncbi:similar to Saccharomyces cerevisiae YDR078C SHU2 Protein involved in a Rad51p- [Maudiozyma barnettii]|uniref:Similar to Saccharomyces cerevisiae YDR078C SHU2 Protein involved in a Rad51p n=1 Tax=Maudiozyma barnettii TaxID=61262 RepID=A0A8H2ZJI7_9SACH|nr:Shu2p [Kazachstania barnettii]CAB4256577.1 similar to Saccharomyces cerevisiae YDR078C SHU2 Protein involved in a Rad51p- [Kazachstania barnettii]CAD1785180.1 similar to Saccharomyces cerevisiae YDR078C SHU2 Protein involved in a Rad51p- [Kazachstania barnettii]
MDKTVNYSELFSQLLDNEGNFNNSMLTFLYYMFPRDLFIRALSLLESNDMMIYILEEAINNDNSVIAEAQRTATLADESNSAKNTITSTNTTEDDKQGAVPPLNATIPIVTDSLGENNPGEIEYMNGLLKDIYNDDDYQLLYRLIVKSDNEPPIYVDLKDWTCSCSEYCELFSHEIFSNEGEKKDVDSAIQDLLVTEIDDIEEFKDDRIGQLDAHSFSKQQYFKIDKIMCSHLLAYSILLRSSMDILKYFVQKKSNVLLFRITNIDEWLKLHINIIV